MINGLNSAISKVAGVGSPATPAGPTTGGTGGTSFADTLKKSIDDVAKLQQDASQAVTDLATGKTENMSGVMTAVEKSDLAFKTLLAIRSKLMDAYDEIKGMSV
jgi:flagellar hook-basal body complex protein FliE